jgi:hypothetical protein
MNRLCVPPVATGSSITAPRFVDASFVSAGAACDVGGVDCTPRSVGVRAGGRRARGVRIAARQTTVCSVWIVLKAACGAQSAQRVRACPPPPPPPAVGGTAQRVVWCNAQSAQRVSVWWQGCAPPTAVGAQFKRSSSVRACSCQRGTILANSQGAVRVMRPNVLMTETQRWCVKASDKWCSER